MRQPQAIRSALSNCNTSNQTSEANRVPLLEPIAMIEATRPRRLAGAYSASITAPPDSSAPAPKPWAKRKITRQVGAQTPIWA
ncbi:hypothetical protein D3C75_901610 [compost metagenome]